VVLLTSLFCLNIMDVVLTIIGLRSGCCEVNIFFVQFNRVGVFPLDVVLRMGVLVMLLFVFVFAYRFFLRQQNHKSVVALYAILVALVVFCSMAVVNNFIVLSSLK
jgi:hypothetical protein